MVALSELAYPLALTAFVSLSGVMMPGPVFAVSLTKGYEDGYAGVWVALGHGLVEFPLMALLFLGFAFLEEVPNLGLIVGLSGGVVLFYLGLSMIIRRKTWDEAGALPHHPMVLGAATTVSNPYFVLWWLTIGLALMLLVRPYAWLGFAAFALVHWSCDLGWNGFVSFTVHRTRRFWGEQLKRTVSVILGAFLLALGGWFVYSGLR